MQKRMRYDYLAWQKSEAEYEAWRDKLFEENVLREIGQYLQKHRGGVAKELMNPTAGAFNVCLQMKFGDGGSAIIRFPQPGNIRFPEEKVRKEVAVMRFVAENTLIPVPFVLHHGTAEEGPAGMGPFILMEYVSHARNMTAELNTPGFRREDRPVLNPQISEAKLKFAYGQMAAVLLHLSRPGFAQIGSLEELEDGDWSVTERPMTFNMNELVSLGNFPPAKLPSDVFQTSSSYFRALADTNLVHLSTQRNDAIESAEDCRRKYVARHLFRKIVSDGQFPSPPQPETKPFKLFCDDFRPSNVLVDEECKIVGVIDWEFSYVAPAEYSYSPPWWLLIESPEEWLGGISDWVKEYEPRLRTFLGALKEREDIMIKDGTLREDQRLSFRMKSSWETGEFWMSYAARKSWAFDTVFWELINTNPRYFDGNSGYEAGLEMLSEEERGGMEDFVRTKLEQSESQTLSSNNKEVEEEIEVEIRTGNWI
ncbi:phosphotransferase family protein [Phlyctema vagabunda]|uniref:Phosphotransferase family protein n=1 Tax=Phlyctema vagabunda TaxID=108571 RepID=A0ABR4P564_9HELO